MNVLNAQRIPIELYRVTNLVYAIHHFMMIIPILYAEFVTLHAQNVQVQLLISVLFVLM